MDTYVESGNRKGGPNYLPELKHRLAVAACDPSVSVSKLAQDHGINSNMLFKWHRDLCWSADRLYYGKHEAAPSGAEAILASSKTGKWASRATSQ